MGSGRLNDNGPSNRTMDNRRTSTKPNSAKFSRFYEWHSLVTMYLFARENGTETGPDLLHENFLDERGTLEAGLVIIPTTLLFLMILQILFAGSWQVMERAKLHDLVIQTSLAETKSSNNESSFGVRDGMYRNESESDIKYFSEKLKSLAEERFSSNSNVRIEEEVTPAGNVHKIEVKSPIPVLSGLLEFLAIKDVGISNTAVYIAD